MAAASFRKKMRSGFMVMKKVTVVRYMANMLLLRMHSYVCGMLLLV